MLDLTQFTEIAWPRVRRVRQKLHSQRLANIPKSTQDTLASVQAGIQPGKTYAIGVGSRGIHNIATITKSVIEFILACKAQAVIVPAMASHGGATAEGQREVLADYGITEQSMGVPIEASMAVHQLGSLPDGTPIYFSEAALKVDGVIPINRVKAHTDFHGPLESGLAKMLVIGFAKQMGAASIHSRGFHHFHHLIPEVAEILLSKVHVPFGVAIVENGYDETAIIKAIPGNNLLNEEAELLKTTRHFLPTIPFAALDILVVSQIGKNISGEGMDPNVTGRYTNDVASGGPKIAKIAILNLTKSTHGNACGFGLADTISKHAYDEVDWQKTYTNALTSTEFNSIKTPMVCKNDRETIEMVLRTANGITLPHVRLAIIKNTLSLNEFVISESLWPEAEQLGLEPLTEWEDFSFDTEGNLAAVAGLPIGRESY